MATMKKAQNGAITKAPIKTAKKPVSTIDKVKKGLSSLTMKDVKDSAESALNLSTLGGYGVAKKSVKKLTGLKNGGSVAAGTSKAPAKKAGPVDPKGAFTKVQKRTLAKAKMAKCGTKMSKK